jgi:tetratricopeptide (TPR) repeat protein
MIRTKSIHKLLTSLGVILALTSCATPLKITPVGPNTAPLANRIEPLYTQGRTALLAGDLAAALEFFHAARRAGPDDVRVLNGLGVIYDRLGRFDLSSQYYQRALSLDPRSEVLAQNLALSAQLMASGSAKPSWSPPVQQAQANAPAQAAATIVAAVEPTQSPTWSPPSDAPQLQAQVQPNPLVLTRSTAPRLVAPRADTPEWTRPAVIVINGTGENGQANRVAGTLRQTGWTIASVGNERPYQRSYTLIAYPQGQRDWAFRIARDQRAATGLFPILSPTSRSGKIELRIGRDFIQRA